MKKNPLILFFFACVIIGLFSTCKRQYMGDFNADYIGEWHSDTMTTTTGEQKEIYFIINGENSEYGFMCLVNCTSCACNLLTSGKAVIKRNEKVMIIGSGNGNERVRVKLKTHPYQDVNGQWKCVILDANGTDIVMYKR